MTDPCGDGCALCEADELARSRYLAKHVKYNTSAKGQKRNRRYEAAHPERKLRWEPAREAARSALGSPPDSPMHDGRDLPPETGPGEARNLALVTVRQPEGGGGALGVDFGRDFECCTQCEGA